MKKKEKKIIMHPPTVYLNLNQGEKEKWWKFVFAEPD